MAARSGLMAVVFGTLAAAVAYAAAFLPGGAPPWAAWAMEIGIAASCVGLMALGAARPGRRLGVLMVPLIFTFVVLVAGFGLALALPGREGVASRLWAGLPVRAAIILYGIGILPMLVLPLSYALTFRQMTLTAEDVERIRVLGAERARITGEGGR
jgi:hypothetical protein